MSDKRNSHGETKPGKVSKKNCFIIMPISTPVEFLPVYKEDGDHFKHVLEYLLIPAIEKADLKPIRPIAKGAELIQGRTIKYIEAVDIVLCDISTLNANVFLELGIRTALNKPICLIRDDITINIPFDTAVINHHTYKKALSPWELEEEIESLSAHIKTSLESSGNSNELWKYFGLTSIAEPAKAGSDEEKFNYISIQIESIKNILSHNIGRAPAPEQKEENIKIAEDETVNEILTILRTEYLFTSMTVNPVKKIIMIPISFTTPLPDPLVYKKANMMAKTIGYRILLKPVYPEEKK